MGNTMLHLVIKGTYLSVTIGVHLNNNLTISTLPYITAKCSGV